MSTKKSTILLIGALDVSYIDVFKHFSKTILFLRCLEIHKMILTVGTFKICINSNNKNDAHFENYQTAFAHECLSIKE